MYNTVIVSTKERSFNVKLNIGNILIVLLVTVNKVDTYTIAIYKRRYADILYFTALGSCVPSYPVTQF